MRKVLVMVTIAAISSAVTACSAVQSTGEAVSDVGTGAGNALSGASQAVGDAGSAIATGAGDVLEGAGNAVTRGAKRTESKGY